MTNIKLNDPIQLIDPHNLECLSTNGCMSLQHTNVRMSGNHKLVWKNDNEIFLESISSDDYISAKTFKAVSVDVNQGYKHNIQQFFSKVAKKSSIWNVKTVEARKSENFGSQYPEMYKWGAYSETNDLIDKRFRFFAPLWTYGDLPDRFLIFRVPRTSYTRARNYITQGELILNVDMTNKSTFGKYLRTLTEDSLFKDYCIFANFNESFIRYYGIDIKSGKFKFNTEGNLDSYLANERTIQEFNNALTNGWMRGELICANLLNLEFAFDDETAPEGFNSYVGVYVKDNEITKSKADILQKQDGIIILNYDEKEVVKYKPNSQGELIPLPDYTQTISTTSTTQLTKTELPPIAEIYLPFKPVPGSVFSIQYNGKTYIEIYMMEEYLKTDSTDEILRMIANEINSNVLDEIIITASVVDSTLIIRSNIVDESYEKIIISLPSVFTMNKPKWFIDIPENVTTEEAYNSMRMISYRDIIVNSSNVPECTTLIEVDGIDYTLEQMYRYRTANVLRLDESFSNVRELKSSLVKFKKNVSSTFSLLSFIKHVDFDMSMLSSPYYDIYDFDLQSYQIAFGNQIHESFERYAQGTQTTLDMELINAYISFFGIDPQIDILSLFEIVNGIAVPKKQDSLENKPPKEVLVKDFDSLTMFPSSTCKNEFERLGEQALIETRNLNRLEPLISKFVCCKGYDSYMNPISLNIALPWRNDNFLSTSYESRSVVNNTHMWFTLGSGPGPMIKQADGTYKFKPYLNSIKKQLSYANLPINATNKNNTITVNVVDSYFDPLNIEFDVFNLLKYLFNDDETNNTYKIASAWTNMFKVEGEENVYNTIYRGAEWSFIGNYEGYRFAVILVTSTKLTTETDFNSPFILVENQVFKTLTLVINHYIPDKLITSLNGNTPYYLDRSYLYYSSKYYVPSEISDAQDINSTEAISLNLFRNYYRINEDDLSEQHTYKGKPALLKFYDNRKNEFKYIDTWFIIDNNQPLFYISLNQINKSITFKDIVKEDELTGIKSVEWMHVNELSDNQVSVLIRYTAYDIVEIGDSHIWCKDIFIEFIVNDVYLEDWDEYGMIHHHTMSLEDIIKNNANTITIDGCEYVIPFWDKISSSQFMDLPIIDLSGNKRKGLRLTKEFFEEVDSRYTYEDSINSFIRTREDGKQFIVFDTVTYENDSDEVKSYINDLTNKVGTLLEKDQYWFMLKSFSKENAIYFNFTSSNQSYNTISAEYVRNILNMYPIKTYIATKDDIVETSKKISLLPPDETYIIVSLGYDKEKNSLYRLDSYTSFKIIRLTGYYSPLFKKILQPETKLLNDYVILFDNEESMKSYPYHNRHIGQYMYVTDVEKLYSFTTGITNDDIHEVEYLSQRVIIINDKEDISKYDMRSEEQIYYVRNENKIYRFYDGLLDENFKEQIENSKEYKDVVFPINLLTSYTGRKICTNIDEPNNYCEEIEDNFIKNIYDQYYYAAQYDGITRNVIADAALSEHRGFISNTYFKEKSFDITTTYSTTLDLISITRDKLGPTILGKYLYNADPSMFDMLNAMKLYNSELDEYNIVYENYYNAFYERFFIEFLQKHYKVTTITASNNMYHKIDFYYSDYRTINLKQASVNGTQITSIILTFTKI